MYGSLALTPGGKYQNWVDYRIPSGYWKSDVWPQMCSALSLGENSLVFLWYGVCFTCTAYVGAFREDPTFEGWPKVERSARFEMKHAWVVLPALSTVDLHVDWVGMVQRHSFCYSDPPKPTSVLLALSCRFWGLAIADSLSTCSTVHSGRVLLMGE